MTKHVGIVLFPEMEELDFVGPLEVFGMLAKYFDKDWRVLLVAETRAPVKGAKDMRVIPDVTFDDAPDLDVLVVPGGQGTRREVDNKRLIEFVRTAGGSARWLTSVCTGAFILSRAGFLDGRKATTHWASLDELRKEPGVEVVEERFARDGNVVTAAGVSAGIDMALYVVGQATSPELARNVQKAMEYYPAPPYSEAAVAIAGKEAN